MTLKPRGLFVKKQEAPLQQIAELPIREGLLNYFDDLPIGINTVDILGNFTYVNKRFLEVSGYSKEEVIGKNGLKIGLFPPDSLKRLAKRMRARLSGKPSQYLELQFKCKDGRLIWVELEARLLKNHGFPIGFQITSRDITYRKQAEEMLADEANRWRMLMQQSRDGIVIIDEDGKVHEANQRFAEMLGYSPDEVSQLYLWDWDTQYTREQLLEMVRTVSEAGDHFETYHRRKDGTTIDVEISSNGAMFAGHKLIFCVCRDISERKKADEAIKRVNKQLMESSNHDIMTGLPNRRLLYEHFDIALASAQRNKKILATISLDLDKFKAINDAFGHDVGDKLLVAAADRMTSILRKTDTVARMGGDEFVVLLWDLDHKSTTVKVAQKILEGFRQPFSVDGHTLNNTVSVGVAIYPENGSNIEELLKSSDKSLYRVKESGRNNYQLSASS
jgi:diguanylate cyclase (GGDEF)-like protein/PAS domain S-box-containing protein